MRAFQSFGGGGKVLARGLRGYLDLVCSSTGAVGAVGAGWVQARQLLGT